MDETRRALVVATSEYEHAGLRQLVAPAQDAEALERVLADPEVGGFHVTTLLNRPALEISLAIEKFFLNRKREDLLLLYYSGHGLRDDDGQLYLTAVNTQLIDRVRPLRATAVGASFVRDVMRDSSSRRQVLVLDCCYSGAFANALREKGGAALTIRDEFKQGRGLVLLTASAAIETSLEGGAGSPSVFTRHLIRGVETGEADLDGDGRIALDELYEYVHDRVTDETPQMRPMKWAFDMDGEIVIAQVRKATMKAAKLSPDLQLAIENTAFRGVREDAVRELGRLLRGKHEGQKLAAREALLRLKDNDDSLLVRNAAKRCLAAYDEEQRQERESAEAVERERQAEQERLARERAEQELRDEVERAAQQKAEQERQERERAEAAERERRVEQERLARERAEQELRDEVERAARQKAEQEWQERERAAAVERERQAEQERLARERAEQELRAEVERAARQKEERERQERESAEAAERERQAEQERLAREQAEAERRTFEAAVAHRAAQQREEQERLAREKAERERLRIEAERAAQQRPADQGPLPNPPYAIGTPAPAPSEPWSSGWGADTAVGAAPAKVAVPPSAISMPGASDLIEEALKHLVPGRMLFNPPEEMLVGAPERVEARISKGLTEDLSAGLKGRGRAQTEEILVGTFMKVQLKGSNFDIKPQAHEEQVVAENDFTQWAWNVTPLKAGSQLLSLLVTVRIKLPDDGEEAKDYPVFDKQIRVRVNLQHTIEGLIRRYWQWLASAVIIPALVWGYGSVTTYRHTQAAMREGDSYMTTHAYEKALRAYQTGLNRDPENSVLQEKTKRARNALTAWKNRIDALVNEGDSDYAKGAYRESTRKYQEALALDPENPALPEKIQRAQDAFAARAGSDIAGALKKQVNDLIKQGDSYCATGAYDEAINEYKKGLNLDPENSVLKNKLQQAQLKKQVNDLREEGDSHYAKGGYDVAIGEYQKGLTLDPNNSVLEGRIQRTLKKQIDTLMKLGDSDREHSHYDEAIAKYRKALSLDPNNQVLAKRITQATNAEEWEKEHGTLKPGSLAAHPKN